MRNAKDNEASRREMPKKDIKKGLRRFHRQMAVSHLEHVFTHSKNRKASLRLGIRHALQATGLLPSDEF